VQVEDSLEREVKEVEYALENDLKSFGKGFTVIEQVMYLAWQACFAGTCYSDIGLTAMSSRFESNTSRGSFDQTHCILLRSRDP